MTYPRLRETVRRVGLASALIAGLPPAAMARTVVTTAKLSPVTTSAAGQQADTAGTAFMQWTYDTWTVPWVQVAGRKLLDPGSYATLVTLACETTTLERDRLARHLSPEECEHRMAAIRADQDTALIFRVHLRILDRSGASELVRLGPNVRAALEDDLGWKWSPPDIRRGAVLGMATSQKVTRVFMYHPQWMRGSEFIHPDQYRTGDRRELTAVEYWIRFPRRDPESGDRILTRHTRWLRLRLSDGKNEWVATWPFLAEEVLQP